MKLPLTLILCCLCYITNASNYYVATDGLDSQAGSLALPFLTIQHGTNQLTAGDTLFIRGGTYFEKIFCNATGMFGNQVIITNYQSEEVIIDGTGITGNEMFVINSKDYITLNGLIFQNNYISGAKGIYVLNDGAGIRITQCTVRNIGWTTDPDADPYSVDPTGQAHGILVNGRTTEGIENLVISDCAIYDIISGNSEALTLVGNVSNFQITRDTVYNTKNIGIVVAGHYAWAVDSGVDASLNQTRDGSITDCLAYNNRRFSNVDAPAGIYADGAKDVLISRNTSYDNGNGMSVGCENTGFSGSHITVTNNIIYANDNQGIYFGSNAANLDSSILKNNTLLENGTLGNFYSEVSLQNSTDCSIHQNILIPKSSSHYAVSIFGYSVTDLIVDNNLAYRYDANAVNIYVEGTPSEFTPTNSLFDDPDFIDPSVLTPNFTLDSTSPAIDQGTLTYGYVDSLDNLGNIRVVNGKLDHGAIETIDGDCPTTLTLDDSYILAGKFTAQSEVIINSSNISSFDDMNIYAPTVTVIDSLGLLHNLVIFSEGCE